MLGIKLMAHLPTKPKNTLPLPNPPNGLFASSNVFKVEFMYFPLYSVASSTMERSSWVVLSIFRMRWRVSEALEATMKNLARFSYRIYLLNMVVIFLDDSVTEFLRLFSLFSDILESDNTPSMTRDDNSGWIRVVTSSSLVTNVTTTVMHTCISTQYSTTPALSLARGHPPVAKPNYCKGTTYSYVLHNTSFQ